MSARVSGERGREAVGSIPSMDRRIEPRRWTAQRAMGVVFGAGAIFAALFLASSLKVRRLTVETERLTISTVLRAPFQEYIPVTGEVQPRHSFYLESDVGGRVEATSIEEGTTVRRGDVILKLANRELELETLRRADLVAAQSDQVANAKLMLEQQNRDAERRMAELEHQIIRQRRIHERDASLHEAKLVADLDYELSRDEYQFLLRQRELEAEREESNRALRRAQLQQTEDSLIRLRQNLEIARQQLGSLVIRAPADGLLSARDAEVGQLKAAGQRLGQVDSQEGFKVRATVDQHYLPRTAVGQEGDFEFAGSLHHLRITRVFPEVLAGNFDVEMEFLSEIPAELKRGQSLQIRLALGDLAEVVTLANGPFFLKSGGQWVFALDEAGTRASRRQVVLGRKNPDAFEVVSGLIPGERVITSAYDDFMDIELIELEGEAQ